MLKFKAIFCWIAIYAQVSGACSTALIIPSSPAELVKWVGDSIEKTGKFPWHGITPDASIRAAIKNFGRNIKLIKNLHLLSDRVLRKINFEGKIVTETNIYEQLQEEQILLEWIFKLWQASRDEDFNVIEKSAIGQKIKSVGKEKIKTESGPLYNQLRDQKGLIEWLREEKKPT